MSARTSSADAELIRSLESAFARHTGHIGLPELQRALGLVLGSTDEQVARRVLRAFDREERGSVDTEAFLASVRALVAGGERERLEFAFRLLDDDADGSISESELLRMIAISSADDEGGSRARTTDELTSALFRAADSDGDGRLSFDELVGVVRKHPQLLRNFTQSEALWMAPQPGRGALLQQLAASPRRAARSPRKKSAGPLRTLDNHRYDLLAIAAWLGGNLALFMYTLGPAASSVPGAGWVQLARAFAACTSLNLALVFIPSMRHVVARLRQAWWAEGLDMDRARGAQRVLGHAILGLSWAHAVAYALAFESGHHALGVRRMLSSTYHGGTGVLVLTIFTALWTVGFLRARGSALLMYLVLAALLLVHAPSFSLWATLPLLGLCYELNSRRRKRSRRALVQELTPLRSGTTCMTIERPAAFRFEAGSYIFVHVPEIAKHTWQPLTISSAPEQSDLTLYVRSEDDWTVALRRAAEARLKRGDKSPWLAHIDGPYGTSSARIFHTRNAVLIGAGHGVTPLASVLSSIVARTSGTARGFCDVRHLQFFWLNRNQYSYEWLSAQLAELQRAPVGIPIGVYTCLTGGRTGSTSAALEITRDLARLDDVRDATPGLRVTMHTGHPDWRVVLTAIADRHAPEPVEVFFCGPPGLGAKLRGHCARIGIRFHEERF
jgi:NADPH oxidase 5